MSALRLITVQGPLSWMGSYDDAVSQNRADGLGKQCTICFNQYKPSEQVIVLPCNQGLHSKCFENGSQQNCPVDRSFFQFEKIFLLGQELVFNSGARKRAIWLSSQLDKINADLEKLIVEIFNQEELDKFRNGEDGILRKLTPLIKIIAQDFLDRYAGTPLNTHEGRFSTDECERAGQLVIAATQAVQDVSTEKLAQALDSDIMEKIKLYFMNVVFGPLVESALEFFCELDTFDRANISNAVWLIQIYVDTLQKSPEFTKIIEEVDRQFYQRHCTALSQIAGENDTYFSRIKIASFLYRVKDSNRFLSINDKEKNPLALRVEYVEKIKAYTLVGGFYGLALFSALFVAWKGLKKVYSFV